MSGIEGAGESPRKHRPGLANELSYRAAGPGRVAAGSRLRMALAILVTIGLAAPASILVAPAPATAAAPKALINLDTVRGSPSIEQQEAEAKGFAVDLVTGTQWGAMTQAQFAAYQMLRDRELITRATPCG